jgi:ATP-dependent Lhr-like helicase
MSYVHSASTGYQVIKDWLSAKGLYPFPFQEEAWQLYAEGLSGIVNAPTGFGKTFSIFLASLIDYINRNPETYKTTRPPGLQLLWITPLRALAKDISRAMEIVLEELGMPWTVAVRNGDTTTAMRAAQKKSIPAILLITPESLHLLFASKGYRALMDHLACIAVDEWHELLGSKRGVQVELAISHIKGLRKKGRVGQDLPLRIWGISATIGNLEEALQVLLGADGNGTIVRSALKKKIELHTILPDTVERFPWAGHLGVRMIDHVLPVIHASRTTLLFINVRSQAEIWYQALLNADPSLAGLIALHHSAIEGELRNWVEEQLHEGTLKVVVTTASLDLGVDFRPVDTVIQIGSPKGVSRFLQRAGRSGHAPHEVSRIYFVPTHSLEIVEGAALEMAYRQELVESRQPVVLAYDVLIQYLVTLAVGEGFEPSELYDEVRTTHCYADLNPDEWTWLLRFITTGGDTLQGYEEYHKVSVIDGLYRVPGRREAMRHRMHVGTIVGDTFMRVRLLSGKYIGTAEESFISKLNPGDSFFLAGRKLQLSMVKDMEAIVRPSEAKKAIVPSWGGGRMPLSANLGGVLRHTYNLAALPDAGGNKLLQFLAPLFDLQSLSSHIPAEGEVLMELIDTRDGHHMFIYPFEGRLVHQSMGSLLAYRLSRLSPITFSIAMSDYGFELLSDQPIGMTEALAKELFNPQDWYADLQKSINATEPAKRKFRDIAVIAGLVFQGMPGAYKKQKHLQSSTGLIYDVLVDNEPTHLLLQQAYTEVLTYEVEAQRLYTALERIHNSNIVITRPTQLTPFCFPIKVDSLREELTSEKLEDRIRRMQQAATE